jgi:hypothetical protein
VNYSASQRESIARLARETSEVLRRAIEAQRLGRSPGDAERRALRAVCEEARENSILVERLVILCKDVWRSLPEARQLPRDVREATLARVITLCIDEFYRADGDGRSGASASDASKPRREVRQSFLHGTDH